MTKATVSAIHSGEKQCIKVVKFDAFIEFRFVTSEVTTVATDHSGVRTVCKSGEIFINSHSSVLFWECWNYTI